MKKEAKDDRKRSITTAPRPLVLQERSARERHAFYRGLIYEPADPIACRLVDKRAWQTVIRVEDLLHDVLLASAGSNEGDAHGVGDDGEGQRDALRGRLGGVLDGCDPGVGLAQQRMSGEERAGMSVGSAAEEEQVEDGQADRVAGGEAAHERLLVLISQNLRVAEVLDIDRVDGRALALRKLVEKLRLEEGVVGIGVVEGHGALVSEEDLPLGEVNHIVRAGGRGQEGGGEGLGEGPAGDSDLEDAVAGDACVLALDYVRAQGGCEGLDAGEGEEIGL